MINLVFLYIKLEQLEGLSSNFGSRTTYFENEVRTFEVFSIPISIFEGATREEKWREKLNPWH